MDKVIETLEELTQITSIMPETRFQMALTMAITDLNRARQLEADCAAMRGALEQAHDLYDCAGIEGDSAARGLTEREKLYADKAKEILANMQQALSSSAGKALLEKVQRLEAEAAAMRDALEKISHPIPWLQKDAENKGYVLNGSAAVYLAKDANWLKDTAKQALSPDAGKALLKRMRRLEAGAEAAKEAFKQIDKRTRTLGLEMSNYHAISIQVRPGDKEYWRAVWAYNESVASLEGGADDAK